MSIIADLKTDCKPFLTFFRSASWYPIAAMEGCTVKSAKAFLLQIFMMAFLFPAMLLSVVQYTQAGDSSPAGQTEPHYITIQRGGELTELDLEEYVAGVVLAEMPSEFQPEALKAQAVVARTFAWKAASTGGKHTDGTLCTNPACCQGYVSEENYLRYYGTPAEVEKIKRIRLPSILMRP